MYIKNKKSNSTSDKLINVTAHVGLLLMSAAATFGVLELPDHSRTQVIVPGRAIFAYANVNTDQSNQLRRERDESAPHYISYAETQRTPSRSGNR